MIAEEKYDVGIVGGGLAGLSLSIQAAKQGFTVILFEKDEYPFHRVCGEYISLESWDFLHELGIDLAALDVPIIKQLVVSGVNGKTIGHELALGGFGISRYLLDHELYKLAIRYGVVVKVNTKVTDITFHADEFLIDAGTSYQVKCACGSFGKRSNIDVKWKRPFISAGKNRLNNYIGVKYHVTGDFAPNQIALHNFRNGYCGLVRIENGQYNLCYLTTANNLRNANGDISLMERTVLCKNPQLKSIFEKATIIPGTQQTISQISFDKKAQVENHVLMIGDAASMITPLCGNGMSMALHGSKTAFNYIQKFLRGQISRQRMEELYTLQWRRNFAKRLRMGRRIQRLFGKAWISNLFISLLKPFPRLVGKLVRQTHGQPF